MSLLISAIIEDYLDPGDREAQMVAFGAFEDYLTRISSLTDHDVTTTDLTVTTQDVEVMLFHLTVLSDKMFTVTDSLPQTRVLLVQIRAYLNLLYTVCGLNRETVLLAYQHKPACKLVPNPLN